MVLGFIDSEDPGIRQDTVTSEVSAFERKLGEVERIEFTTTSKMLR